MKSRDVFQSIMSETKINKKRSRKGSLLILVMVIMAVALILITSAMTITVAARSHYNKTAEMDQSKLTAMSGAKMIWDAVNSGKITTTLLDDLAAPATGTTYYLQADASVSPGMLASNTASDSYTTATFKYSNAAKDEITVDVTTHIDNAAVDGAGSTETVTLYLKKQVTIDTDGFQAVMSLESAGDLDFSNMIVGENAPTGALNILVMNSDLLTAGTEQAVISDLIVRHEIKSAGGTVFKGNIILYGNDASIATTGGGTSGNGLVTSGYMFALGGSAPTTLPVASITSKLSTSYVNPLLASFYTPASGSFGIDNGGMNNGIKALALYISNSLLAYDKNYGPGTDWTNSQFYFPDGVYVDNYGIVSFDGEYGYTPSIYKLSTTANVWTSGTPSNGTDIPNTGTTISNTIKALASTYTSASVKKTIERTLTDAKTTAQTQISTLGLLSSAAAVQTAVTSNTLAPLNSYLTTGASGLNAAAYYFDVKSSNQTLTGDLIFDLTDRDITIYIYGDNTLTINQGGLIQFINGGAHSGRIIMYGNADITIANNNDAGNSKNRLLSPTGIVATTGGINVMTSTGISSYSYLNKNVACDPVNCPLITYPITANKLPSPFLYIYGFGYNNISVGVWSYLQGYVGLYNNSSATNQGTLHFMDRAIIYGRFECASITSDNKTHVPYCPPPSTSGGGLGGTTAKYDKLGYVVK